MANLATYRTRLTNSLNDTTTKYSTDVLDEALRKVLNEYSRAFPNLGSQVITLTSAGRTQSLAACSNLISVLRLPIPTMPPRAERTPPARGIPANLAGRRAERLFQGLPIPLSGEKLFVEFAGKQTIDDLDSATATTVRADHEDLLVVGASGQAAMIRASGLNEAWGVKSGEMSQLMVWGNNQYNRFVQFLAEVRTELSVDIFPDRYWELDRWDKANG
jgi:hypothetical protein